LSGPSTNHEILKFHPAQTST